MRTSRPRHGFILLTALAMLAIVGVALLALGSAMVYDAKRTMDRSQRAQLDELLQSATTDAVKRLKTATPNVNDEWDMELPDALVQQDAKLTTTVDVSDESELWLKAHAQLGKLSSEQSLQFRREGQAWHLARAEVPL
jgi:Tfp pilus assembly protein PilX